MNTYRSPSLKANPFVRFLASTVLLLSLASAYTNGTPRPEDNIQPMAVSEAHLSEVEHKFFDTLLLDEGQSLHNVKRVFVADAKSSFSRHWIREHRSISKSYINKTQQRYRRIFGEKLSEAIEEHPQLTLAATAAEADLILYPELHKLNIFGPDDSLGKSLVFTAGNAELSAVGVLASTLTGKNTSIIKYIDHRETRRAISNRPEQATRASNTRDFRMMMSLWSKRLVSDLATRANTGS